MKTAIISLLSLLVVILTGIALFTVQGRSIRKAELSGSMKNAIEKTMEVLYIDKTYTIANQQELMADFVMNFCCQMNSQSDLEICVMDIDWERGLLDIEVRETYRQFTGKEAVLSCRKTVILEKKGVA